MITLNETEMLTFGERLGKALVQGDKIALSGTLGAGKTTLARGILRGLGYDGEVPSPSFAIVQQYEKPEVNLPVAHVDFYRIENSNEIPELGLEDALINGAMVAEWPDHMPDSFWYDGLRIALKIQSETIRQLTWAAGPAWKDRWPIV